MVIPTSLLPETIAMSVAGLQRQIALTPGKRVLFLTKDMDLIKQQLYHGLNLQMKDINPEDLLDDINTDVMTPAWVCFDHDPAEIAKNAYAGLKHNGLRVFNENALIKGNFEVIVSGQRKGTGSSRETAAQCERWAGIRIVIAASFAPIHERNNINLGQLMGDYKMLEQLADAEMTGPILEGMQHPVQLVARQDGVRHIVNMAAICVADAMRKDSYWETLANNPSDS